jgi:hypothetical protein
MPQNRVQNLYKWAILSLETPSFAVYLATFESFLTSSAQVTSKTPNTPVSNLKPRDFSWMHWLWF